MAYVIIEKPRSSGLTAVALVAATALSVGAVALWSHQSHPSAAAAGTAAFAPAAVTAAVPAAAAPAGIAAAGTMQTDNTHVSVVQAAKSVTVSKQAATTTKLQSHAAAPAAAAGTTSMDMASTAATTSSSADSSSCTDLASAIVNPFVVHVDRGHLEESPGQQVSDILNLDQYVKTHTVLVESMTSWDQEIAPALTGTISAFVVHVQHGHLEESPGQQAQDILDADQYVKTHTVLVENMTTPWTNMADGTC